MIQTFGWPIGLMHQAVDHMRPKPAHDGIINTVIREGKSYDFWALRRDGSFYLLQSFFEDIPETCPLTVDYRIMRTAEMLVYLSRVYKHLDIPPSTKLSFILRHVGLRGRYLTRRTQILGLPPSGPAEESEVESSIILDLASIEQSLSQHVRTLLSRLFMLFDFSEVNQPTYDRVVETFMQAFRDGRLI